MPQLHQTKCMNHVSREAAARCPVCRNFFCRECITEHEGKVICASCLLKQVETADSVNEPRERNVLRAPMGLLKALFSFLILWVMLYVVGRLLLLLPDSFHSGDLWKNL